MSVEVAIGRTHVGYQAESALRVTKTGMVAVCAQAGVEPPFELRTKDGLLLTGVGRFPSVLTPTYSIVPSGWANVRHLPATRSTVISQQVPQRFPKELGRASP